jgi:hypothetical protein
LNIKVQEPNETEEENSKEEEVQTETMDEKKEKKKKSSKGTNRYWKARQKLKKSEKSEL